MKKVLEIGVDRLFSFGVGHRKIENFNGLFLDWFCVRFFGFVCLLMVCNKISVENVDEFVSVVLGSVSVNGGIKTILWVKEVI